MKKATPVQLVFLIYAVVCSGAYGVESMISTVGPGLAILTLTVLPIVYALPVTLACAELTARHPVEGGYYRWARLAFGDLAGYTSGWLMWLASFATNASIAVLFTTYLRYFLPALTDWQQAAFSAVIVWLAIGLNLLGISIVGFASVLVTAAVLTPFVLMTILGAAQSAHAPLTPFVHPELSLSSAMLGGVVVAMWLYGGFEKMTVAAEEVEDPARAFPRALALALPLCALSYIVPTVAALAAVGDWSEWGEAYYVTAAARIGGPWLGVAMAAGALISNFGILMATILSQSRLPMVLAEDGLWPAVFARRHPRFGTPVVSLLVTGVVLTALCALPFAHLVSAAGLVQSLSYLLIFAALLGMRRRQDAGSRAKFRIPLGTPGLLAMMAPSVVIVALVIWTGVFPDGELHVTQAAVIAVLLASGPLTYALRPAAAPLSTSSQPGV